MILTFDLGTSVTKASLWDGDGLVAEAGSGVSTRHPRPGWAEQDPSDWWASVVDACSQLRAGDPTGFGAVEAIGCTGARQTFALVDASGLPLGPGIVWSDRRAGEQVDALSGRLAGQGAGGGMGAGDGVWDRTGVPLEAASVAAKLAWLAAHDGGRLEASAWILTPRDLVGWRLTGDVATDPSMASRSGLYDLDGLPVGGLVGPLAAKLAPIVPSDRVTGRLGDRPAAALALPVGTPVVLGAGDRACEVLGSGATEVCPMVSWGTTANLSLPLPARPVHRPPGLVLSRAASGGWLLEGGLSAAGSWLAWLGRISGHPPAELAALARSSPPGARGVLATPWLDGARAPWWRPDAGAAFIGLSSANGLADLARAGFESVAWEVHRCLEAARGRRPSGPEVERLVLGGAGAAIPVWSEVLTGITGLPAARRRSGQAASAGAALLAAAAVGREVDLERLDPLVHRADPDPATVNRYAAQEPVVERTTVAVAGLAGPPCS